MNSYIFLLSALLFALTACSGDASFSTKASSERQTIDQPTGTSNAIDDGLSMNEPVIAVVSNNNRDQGVPVPLSEVINNCNTSAVFQRSIPFFFPKPENTCDWGEDGNLDERDGFFQARIEQVAGLNLPTGAVLCDAEFQFAEQDFLYDDHFLLTLNNSVIASSYNFESRLQRANNLLQYDWSRLVGMDWEGDDEEVYCPQIPNSQASCSFPGHDLQGRIELDYDKTYIQSIMANGLQDDHFFSMISIGDNDSMDCEHSDVRFIVQVKYYLQ